MSNINSMSIGVEAIENSRTNCASLNKRVKNRNIISGLKMNWWHFKIRITLVRIITKAYANPKDWFLAFKYLIQLRKKF